MRPFTVTAFRVMNAASTTWAMGVTDSTATGAGAACRHCYCNPASSIQKPSKGGSVRAPAPKTNFRRTCHKLPQARSSSRRHGLEKCGGEIIRKHERFAQEVIRLQQVSVVCRTAYRHHNKDCQQVPPVGVASLLHRYILIHMNVKIMRIKMVSYDTSEL